jgi:tetratricopeptide (TPR) repeat protein
LKDFIRNVFKYNPTCPDKETIDKNLFVLNLRRRKAMTILSKGHMIKNSLNYDITQNNNFGGDNHDTETSTFRFPSSTVIRDPLCNASITDSQEIITAINFIAVLWNEAAIEFEDLNEYQESLSIYKVLATLWGNFVEFQPYSKILINFDSRLLQQNKDGMASNLESSTSDPGLNITYASLLPLQLNSAINSNQIDAAKKGWMAWNSAARIAHKICDICTIEKVREVDFELLLWNQVIFCKYKAGLCAMVYDTQIAQSEFELAQSFKAKYDELAGSLIVDLPDIQASHQNDIDNSAVIRLSTQPRKKKMVLQSAQQRQQWIAYNTLCCDISYHLGHTYLRTGNFAYAIAEAEMAIALAIFSSEMKVRQRKAWGLLALGMSTGLQMGEAFKALNEVSKIKIPLENMEDDESQLRSSMKFIVDERNITHGITSDDTRKDSSFIKHEMKINLNRNVFNDFMNGNKNQSLIMSVFVVMIATLIGFFYFYRNNFFRWLEYCGQLYLEYFI